MSDVPDDVRLACAVIGKWMGAKVDAGESEHNECKTRSLTVDQECSLSRFRLGDAPAPMGVNTQTHGAHRVTMLITYDEERPE